MPKKNTEKKKAASKASTKKKGAKKSDSKKPEIKEEAPKKILVCTGCEYTSGDSAVQIVLKEKVNQPDEIVSVIEKEANTLPLIDVPCPKCSHNKAFFWTLQTRAADEPETKFMRCEKCNHTWRDYD